MDTSGRAVVFSGIAVAIGLGSLLFFRGSFLAGLGLAAGIVVMLSILAALTFLPALLVWLGPRIDAGQLRLPRLVDETPVERLCRGAISSELNHPNP